VFIKRVYEAYWLEGRDISQLDLVLEMASDFVSSVSELKDSICSDRFGERIVPFDEPAFATGVYNLPTYWIGGERFAEQPMTALRKALQNALVSQ
jgi:2-hydroxychromene-2-carboxylate isomerase